MNEQKERLGLVLFLDILALALSTLAVYMITNQLNQQPLIGDLTLVLLYYAGIKALILAIADVTGIGRSVLVAIFFTLLANGVVIMVELFMSMGVTRQLMLIIAIVDVILIAIVHTLVKVTAPGYKESKERKKWLADRDQIEDGDHDQLLDNLVSEKTSEIEAAQVETQPYKESKVDLEPVLLTQNETIETNVTPKFEDTAVLSQDDNSATADTITLLAADKQEIPVIDDSATESNDYFDNDLYDDLGVTDEILTELVKEQIVPEDETLAEEESGRAQAKETEEADSSLYEATIEETETFVETGKVVTDETARIVPAEVPEETTPSEENESDEAETMALQANDVEDTKPVDSIASMTKSHHLETNLDYMRRSSKQTEAEELLNAVNSFSKELDCLEVSYSDEELSKTGNNIRQKLKIIVDKQYVLDEVMEDLTQLSQQINMRIDDLDRIESELKRRADVLKKRESALDEIEKPVEEELSFVLEPDEILVEMDGTTVIINKDDYELLMKNSEK